MITASKIELAMKCQGAFALPGIIEIHAGQEEGNELHEEHEEAIESGNIPEILRERWPNYLWRAEVSFAIDVSTGKGRVLGVGLDRAYDRAGALAALGIAPLGPFEVSGTADVVGRGPRGELVIADWKSFDPNVSRAAKNAQLHTLALAATRAFELDECQVALSHMLRPFDVADIGPIDLDVFETELRKVFESVAKAKGIVRNGGMVPLTPGTHCRYCPALIGPQGVACPAQKDLAAEMTKADTVMAIESRIPFESDADAADAFDLWQRLKLLTNRVGAALHARAGEREFVLNDGRVFGPREKQGNLKLDGEKVWQLLNKQYGPRIADQSVRRVATQKHLEEALKMTGKPVAPQKKKVIDELKARGGATQTTKTVVEVYEPQRVLKEGTG